MFDLKDGSEFTFDVPYMATHPYTPVNGSIGTVSMFVVSPLNSPTNGATSIDMMVYVSCLPGFEFAGITSSILDGFAPGSAPTVYTQAGGVEATDDASQDTIGERFTSVKQVAMVPDYHIGPDKATSTISDFTLAPWFRKNFVSSAVPIPNNAQAVFWGSKSGRMAEMFSFVNGSTEYAMYHDGQGSNCVLQVAVDNRDGGNTIGSTAFTDLYQKRGMVNTFAVTEYVENALRVNVPFYSTVSRVPLYVYLSTCGTNQTTDVGLFSVANFFSWQMFVGRIRNNSGSARRFFISRAAGDDATMGQYIGPPICAYFQSTATVSPNPNNFLL
jgi:hypothetical protein